MKVALYEVGDKCNDSDLGRVYIGYAIICFCSSQIENIIVIIIAEGGSIWRYIDR